MLLWGFDLSKVLILIGEASKGAQWSLASLSWVPFTPTITHFSLGIPFELNQIEFIQVKMNGAKFFDFSCCLFDWFFYWFFNFCLKVEWKWSESDLPRCYPRHNLRLNKTRMILIEELWRGVMNDWFHVSAFILAGRLGGNCKSFGQSVIAGVSACAPAQSPWLPGGARGRCVATAVATSL